MSWTIYSIIAGVVALGTHLRIPEKKFKAFVQDALVGTLWPILWPVILYFFVKGKFTLRPWGGDISAALEIMFCLTIGICSLIAYGAIEGNELARAIIWRGYR